MRFFLLTTICLLILGTAWAQPGPTVFVTVPPQKYFLEKIGGDRISVKIMVPPGANPHTYEPRPRQMTELAGAAAYFTVGDAFDHTWLERILGASPDMAVVHTAEGVEKIPMSGHHGHGGHEGHDHHAAGHDHAAETHDHGEYGGHDHSAEADRHDNDDHAGHGHDHGALDPHIWLDPALVKIQAANIRDGLSAVDPEGADVYARNTAAFLQELDELDREIRDLLAPTFLVFHPSWGYFARAYGLTQAPIEVDGKEPSPRDMARIIATGRETGARVVFVQPQFSQKSASVIAAQIDARVVRLDPLAEDWSANLLGAARAFAEALALP
jgi:zinc transport system substrate-binding protein